ncbi:MAG: protein kinase [Polyangiaceae bacterium]
MRICPWCLSLHAPDVPHVCDRGPSPGPAPREARRYEASEIELPTADVAPMSALMLGDYRVLSKIGSGGMGTVYLVEHVRLRKRFAAKVLSSVWASDPDALRRFEIEAIAASRVEHDNIVNVANFGRADDGTVFLVMEHLRGTTLRETLSRGGLSLDAAVRITTQICRGIGAAHAAGIVHRDLKPDNVFLSSRSDGRLLVKLFDFGISKLRGEAGAGAPITRVGCVVGTPVYMSPEAARGEEVDARGDLYAVGVMLYEMVTGAVPFTADNELLVLHLHQSEPPRPPSEKRPDLSSALEAVILKSIAKSPRDRFQSADELASALLAALPTDVEAPLVLSSAPPPLSSADKTRPTASGSEPTRPARTLPSEREAAATRAGTPPTNLALQPTRFVGRPDEIRDVTGILRDARLVTLLGTGGVGKTRLSIEIASELLVGFPDGAWMVELAGLSDGALVAGAVARVLGFETRAADGATELLVRALRDRRMLVVLDNCEHLVGACATVVDALLRACPRVRVLATSREPLGVAGETTYRVPPLALPDAAGAAGDLGGFASVELFVERARAASPSFRVTDENASAIAGICVRLDGIPLALELAAARARSQSVQEIQSRLSDAFRVLTGGSRAALPRQQTLRALVDWSFDLLDEPQRVLFRRLSVFAGTFALAEAESVASDAPLDAADVAELLTQLVDRSMVVADTRGPTTRYRLLETMRQYASLRLEASGDAAEARRRHVATYLRLAEELRAKYADSTEDAEWFRRLDLEHDNLREAIRASLRADESADEPVSHRFVVALRKFWLVRNHYTEARAFLAPMLARCGAPTPARLDLLEASNTFAQLQFAYDVALDNVREGLALARSLGERYRESILQTHLVYVHFLMARYAEGDALSVEALRLARAVDAPFALIFALNITGLVASRVDDHARAIELLGDCRRRTETFGGRQYHANVLESLGSALSRRDGHYGEALPLFRESAAVFVAVGDAQGQLAMCERMAEVAASRRNAADAVRLLAAADRARERLGSPREPVYAEDVAVTNRAIDAALSHAEQATLRAEGRRLAFADAMALALAVE